MNRVITRWIVAFAALSTALMLTLVITRDDGRALLEILPRERALFAFATLLLLFPLFVLPGVLARGEPEARSVALWLLIDSLLFAAVPLVFSAYISAVSASGLLRLGLLIATVTALPLAFQRLGVGTRGVRGLATSLCGLLLMLPVLGLLATAARADRFAAVLATVSPLDWVARIALRREVPELVPFALAAASVWAVAILPRRVARPTLLACACALMVLPASEPFTWRQLGSFPVRAGVRVAVEVVAPRGESAWILNTGGSAVSIPADGVSHQLLVTVTDPSAWGRVTHAGATEDLAPPWRVQDARQPVRVRVAETPVEGAWVDQRALALGPAALEAPDVVVLSESCFGRLGQRAQAALQTAAACGALVIIEDAVRAEEKWTGTGGILRVQGPATALPVFYSWKKPEFSIADREFLGTVAPLGWQELDLSAVLWFTLAYHAAFLAAFLLPLLLDAHKAPRVYLASVTFVVLVVAFGGYRVLKSIFLRDNQVYTQSTGLMLGEARAGAEVLLRRFVAYASMSAEERLVVFPDASEPMLVSAASSHGAALREDMHRAAWWLKLDRHEGKTLARLDDVLSAPWSVVAEGRGFRCQRNAGEGLFAEARITGALLVEGGQVVARFAPAGEMLLPTSELELFPPGVEGAFRKLQGRYGREMPRHLLLALNGMQRGDVPEDWLVERDAGCYWMVPLP